MAIGGITAVSDKRYRLKIKSKSLMNKEVVPEARLSGKDKPAVAVDSALVTETRKA
jgi:cytochrome c-type biogenesis protein CcmF